MNPSKIRPVTAKLRFSLRAVFPILLCLALASCSGFFVNPSISSIYVNPPSATISIGNTVQLVATARYSDGTANTHPGTSVGWSSSTTDAGDRHFARRTGYRYLHRHRYHNRLRSGSHLRRPMSLSLPPTYRL